VNGFLKAVSSPEAFKKFEGSAHGVERRNFKNAGIIETGDPFVLIFLEQGFEYGPGRLAVFCEDITLSDILRTIAPGKRRLVEGHIADEIEGIEILANLLCQWIKQQTFVLQLFNNGLFAIRCIPVFEKVIETGKAFFQSVLGIVAKTFRDQFAIFVKVFDSFGQDSDLPAPDVVFCGFL